MQGFHHHGYKFEVDPTRVGDDLCCDVNLLSSQSDGQGNSETTGDAPSFLKVSMRKKLRARNTSSGLSAETATPLNRSTWRIDGQAHPSLDCGR
jgi:hypothetical protein